MGHDNENEIAAATGSAENSGEAKVDINENDDYKYAESSFMSSNEQTQTTPNCCDNKVLLFKTILSGQVLSVMLCSTGTAVTALHRFYDIRTPCFNAFTMYTLLAFTFGIYTIKSKHFITLVKKHGWKYFIVVAMDVEANFLLTKAYSYTTLTSVQLCDSFTIPTVMVVSFIFLRVRYKIIHYIGVVLCISGAVCLIFSDSGGEENGSNEIVGDVMALCAAALYGISQVGQEYLVKRYSWKEYLGMVGLIGTFLSGIQMIILERNQISDIQWSWQVGLILLAFAVCQYFYYAVMPYVMMLSSATVVNLSILTSDLYTLVVGLFLFNYKFSYLYFIAFGGIFIGLLTYNLRPTPQAPPRKKKTKKTKENEKDDDVTVSKIKKAKWYTILLQKETKIPLLDNTTTRIQYTQL